MTEIEEYCKVNHLHEFTVKTVKNYNDFAIRSLGDVMRLDDRIDVFDDYTYEIVPIPLQIIEKIILDGKEIGITEIKEMP